MIRTVITLRARFCGDPPRPGELMAAETGSAVYRVETVWTLRQAGERPGAHRYRLACTRLLAAEVPSDAEIHLWRWGGRPPRQTAPQAAPVPWVAPPVSKATHRPSGRSAEAHAGGGDFGPGLRRRAMRDHRGRYIRDADVEVSDEREGDPDYPNRRVRRARRVDSIDLLQRGGTIGQREAEAAGELRQYLEGLAPPIARAGSTTFGIAPHLLNFIGEKQMKAAKRVREAAAALGEKLWAPVLWVCLGGTVRGYAAQWRVGTHRASALVGDGLARLGDHFYGRAM